MASVDLNVLDILTVPSTFELRHRFDRPSKTLSEIQFSIKHSLGRHAPDQIVPRTPISCAECLWQADRQEIIAKRTAARNSTGQDEVRGNLDYEQIASISVIAPQHPLGSQHRETEGGKAVM